MPCLPLSFSSSHPFIICWLPYGPLQTPGPVDPAPCSREDYRQPDAESGAWGCKGHGLPSCSPMAAPAPSPAAFSPPPEVLSALPSKCSLAWPRPLHPHLAPALASHEASASPQGTSRPSLVSSLPSVPVQTHPPPGCQPKAATLWPHRCAQECPLLCSWQVPLPRAPAPFLAPELSPWLGHPPCPSPYQVVSRTPPPPNTIPCLVCPDMSPLHGGRRPAHQWQADSHHCEWSHHVYLSPAPQPMCEQAGQVSCLDPGTPGQDSTHQ